MRYVSRSSLPFLLALPLVFLFAASAGAQTCNQCTPYSFCDESCTRCRGFTQDGCLEEIESTCGEFGGACMQCTPSYVETSRVVHGTYGNGSMFSCSHHKVEQVTSLKNFRRVIWGNLPWFGLSPKDEPLLLRDVGTQEVYALDFEAP